MCELVSHVSLSHVDVECYMLSLSHTELVSHELVSHAELVSHVSLCHMLSLSHAEFVTC